MKILKKIRNYFCYCGIEKDEFNALKKDAYVSNFKVWRILISLMVAVFGVLSICSLFSELLKINSLFYFILFIYSAIAAGLFFVLKKDSLIAQLLIYLSISALFLFGCLITQNKPNSPATTFIVLLLITPMFMIDKPYFMTTELAVASAVFLIWMSYVKPYAVWQYDLVNVITFNAVGVFIHIIANSIRIKEFVLTRQINIQKDTDDLTGLKNKGAITREINEFLSDDKTDKGVMFLLDIDRFKSINDTYGHDVGDSVISQLGGFLDGKFTHGEIVGRFGGDEFIVFIKNTDDTAVAADIADGIVNGVSEKVKLPETERTVSVSIGIAVYKGIEKNYSEIFKKADTALYKVKTDRMKHFCFYD